MLVVHREPLGFEIVTFQCLEFDKNVKYVVKWVTLLLRIWEVLILDLDLQ